MARNRAARGLVMTPDAVALMLRTLPDAVIISTMQGKVVHWSEGARAIFGYMASEATEQPIIELIVPTDQVSEHRRMLEEILASGGAVYESVRRRKDGSLLYVDISSKRFNDEETNEPLILFVEKDVTHIKVLRDSKLMDARFRDLLESTPDGIVMANPTGYIVLANTQAEKLFGYSSGELRGKPVDTLLPERYRHAHVGHRSQYFLQPRKRAMGSGLDLSGLRKDGTEFPIEISLSPLHTEESAFVLSAIRDISERKEIQKALQESNAELARANLAKDHFLANMSHELRTPLNAIIGFTGTLLMKLPGPLTAEQDKQLRTVQSSGRHLLALINDLLDVAKIESGKVELNREVVDCGALVEDVATTLRPLAEGKGLELLVTRPGTPLLLCTDHRALSQIVLNLTSNAIKFTDHGRVNLTLALNAENHSAVRMAKIAISDTGVGISESDQEKLFGAFSRFNTSRERAPEGTGLGLHLSQKLAHALGGSISCQSELGKGSTFVVTVPEG
jgi:PAS domain S-box-containing protein